MLGWESPLTRINSQPRWCRDSLRCDSNVFSMTAVDKIPATVEILSRECVVSDSCGNTRSASQASCADRGVRNYMLSPYLYCGKLGIHAAMKDHCGATKNHDERHPPAHRCHHLNCCRANPATNCGVVCQKVANRIAAACRRICNPSRSRDPSRNLDLDYVPPRAQYRGGPNHCGPPTNRVSPNRRDRGASRNRDLICVAPKRVSPCQIRQSHPKNAAANKSIAGASGDTKKNAITDKSKRKKGLRLRKSFSAPTRIKRRASVGSRVRSVRHRESSSSKVERLRQQQARKTRPLRRRIFLFPPSLLLQ